MKTHIVLICSMTLGAPMLTQAQTVVVDFNKETPGKAPKGFSTALTGKGAPGDWIVDVDKQDPSRGNVLAQTSMDKTGYRFPVCVYDGISTRDVEVSVHFKPLKGTRDQAAGIVWRYSDNDNYYIVRANALEDNVVMYKVEKGKRTDLPVLGKGRTYGEKVKVPSGKWSTLKVVAKGTRFDVYLEEKMLFRVEDATFTAAGKIGLWTKADSYTLFDDLSITILR